MSAPPETFKLGDNIATTFKIQPALHFTNDDQGVVHRIPPIFNLAGANCGHGTMKIAKDSVVYLRCKIDSGSDRPLIGPIRGVGYQIGGDHLSG